MLSRFLLLILLLEAPAAAFPDIGYDLGVSPFGARLEVFSLQGGQTAEAALSDGERHVYILPGSDRRVYAVELGQPGLDLELKALSQDGTILLTTHCEENILCRNKLLFSSEANRPILIVVESKPGQRRLHYNLYITGASTVTERGWMALSAFEETQQAEVLFANQSYDSVEGSIAKYKSALGKWQRLQDLQGEGEAFRRLGDALLWIGKNGEALQRYASATSVFRQVQDASGAAYADVAMGAAMTRVADASAAVNRLQLALAYFTSSGDLRGQALALHHLSNAYLSIGEARQSLEKSQRSLELWNAIGDRHAGALTMISMAAAEADLKDMQSAMQLYREALSTLRRLNDRRSVAIALANMGLMYSEMGEFQKALNSCEEALDTQRELGDVAGQAQTLDNLGVIYHHSGDLEKGYLFSMQALPLRQQAEDRAGEAATLNHLGQYYQDLGQSAKALESFQQSYDRSRTTGARRDEAIALRNMAEAETSLNQTESAATDLKHAGDIFVQVGDIAGQASCILAQARISEDAGGLDAALDLYQKALVLIRTGNDRPGEAGTLLRIARIQRARRQFKQAADNAEESIRILESIRSEFLSHSLRVSYLSATRDVYEFYADLLFDMHSVDPRAGYDALAFRISEGARARSFADLLAEKDLDRATVLPPPATLMDVQQRLLEPDTVLLEFLIGKEKGFAWAVTRTECLMYPIARAADVQKMVFDFVQLLRTFDAEQQTPGAYGEKAQTLSSELAELLLVPAASLLKDKRILISGDGSLQYLPFAVLQLPGSSRPLGIDHQIVYLPSATSLLLLREELKDRKPPAKTIALLADPVFDPADPRIQAPTGVQRWTRSAQSLSLTRIPFTRREAQSILNLVPQSQSWLSTDSDASRQTLESKEMQNYKYIHIATHGILDASNPDLSGLVLSLYDRNGTPLAGRITATDIFQLNLKADLVVLSGCSTALGKEVRGEGLIGMVRAFMYAGTPRVLASLWNVEDAATVEFMRHFYDGILRRKLTPAASLQETQRYIWRQKRWHSPYYWAAFLLVGEFR